MPSQLEACFRYSKYYLNFLRTVNDLYLQGKDKVIETLNHFDQEWGQIEQGHSLSLLSLKQHYSLQLRVDYPLSAPNLFILRQHPKERSKWLEIAGQIAHQLGSHEDEATIYVT